MAITVSWSLPSSGVTARFYINGTVVGGQGGDYSGSATVSVGDTVKVRVGQESKEATITETNGSISVSYTVTGSGSSGSGSTKYTGSCSWRNDSSSSGGSSGGGGSSEAAEGEPPSGTTITGTIYYNQTQAIRVAKGKSISIRYSEDASSSGYSRNTYTVYNGTYSYNSLRYSPSGIATASVSDISNTITITGSSVGETTVSVNLTYTGTWEADRDSSVRGNYTCSGSVSINVIVYEDTYAVKVKNAGLHGLLKAGNYLSTKGLSGEATLFTSTSSIKTTADTQYRTTGFNINSNTYRAEIVLQDEDEGQYVGMYSTASNSAACYGYIYFLNYKPTSITNGLTVNSITNTTLEPNIRFSRNGSQTEQIFRIRVTWSTLRSEGNQAIIRTSALSTVSATQGSFSNSTSTSMSSTWTSVYYDSSSSSWVNGTTKTSIDILLSQCPYVYLVIPPNTYAYAKSGDAPLALGKLYTNDDLCGNVKSLYGVFYLGDYSTEAVDFTTTTGFSAPTALYYDEPNQTCSVVFRTSNASRAISNLIVDDYARQPLTGNQVYFMDDICHNEVASVSAGTASNTTISCTCKNNGNFIGDRTLEEGFYINYGTADFNMNSIDYRITFEEGTLRPIYRRSHGSYQHFKSYLVQNKVLKSIKKFKV